ncbi:transcription factor bHLH68-like isoform X1 [Olea europaea subsp. europaea]|uniref:Transcription factor bHLH68-like isoform X1 n=1 Tax=Olea europaea subsp. europaea TaxID=158383 RepID=A0A8S0R6C5_OLEEU|nr:transcription factor bHLH68-like isoform X1 [Olea europaea subsp. europaea]
MMPGNPNWWSINGMHPQYQHQISSSQSSTASSQYLYGSSSFSSNSSSDRHTNQEFPLRSWSQLLMGGFTGDEDMFGTTLLQQKALENGEDKVLNSSSFRVPVLDVKQESSHYYRQVDDEFQACKSSWPQLIPVSSPNSCITSLSNSFLNFSSSKGNRKNQNPDQYSSKCNSTITGGISKKPRVQQSSTQPALKVRKEKLGDRITTLHQLVSPFGKTDTASVLSEAIGYIRFLQAQIEAICSPNMRNTSGSIGHQQSVQERNCLFPEEPVQFFNEIGYEGRGASKQGKQSQTTDLKSRGLCLVPVSFTQHVGHGINGASDCWTPALGGGF